MIKIETGNFSVCIERHMSHEPHVVLKFNFNQIKFISWATIAVFQMFDGHRRPAAILVASREWNISIAVESCWMDCAGQTFRKYNIQVNSLLLTG